jgi:Domain of unknown function (DUF4249)
MRHIFPILMLLLALTHASCVRNIEIDIEGDNKVVVYGMLEAGKEPRIYLYRSIPFELDVSVPPLSFINDAQVFLINNDERILLSPQQGYEKTIFRGLYQPGIDQQDSVLVTYYSTDISVKSGETYQLEVNYDGEQITSSTQVPEVIEWKSAIIEKDTSVNDEGETIIRDLLVLTFDDPPGKENYYKYTVDYQQEVVIQGDSGPETVRVNYSFLRNRFISDEGNDGRTFRIRFIVDDKVNTFQNPDYVFQLQTTLINYDPFFINFNRSLIQQGGDEESLLNPFREPVIIKSNINGGLGIFSSLAQSEVTIVPYQPGN